MESRANRHSFICIVYIKTHFYLGTSCILINTSCSSRRFQDTCVSVCVSLDHRVFLLVASFSLAASSGSCPGRCTHSHTYTAAHLHTLSHTHIHTVARKRAQKLFIVPLFLAFFDNCLNLRLFLQRFSLFFVNLRRKWKYIYESISIIYRKCEMLCVFSTFISSVFNFSFVYL